MAGRKSQQRAPGFRRRRLDLPSLAQASEYSKDERLSQGDCDPIYQPMDIEQAYPALAGRGAILISMALAGVRRSLPVCHPVSALSALLDFPMKLRVRGQALTSGVSSSERLERLTRFPHETEGSG